MGYCPNIGQGGPSPTKVDIKPTKVPQLNGGVGGGRGSAEVPKFDKFYL